MSVTRAKQKRCSVWISDEEEFEAYFYKTPTGHFRFDFVSDTSHHRHFVRLSRNHNGTTWTAKEILIREQGGEEEVIRAISAYSGKDTAEQLLRVIYEAEPYLCYPRVRHRQRKASEERHISDSVYGRYTTK